MIDISPRRYRKKPVEIEALQWDGTAEGATPIIDWVLTNDGSAAYICEDIERCSGSETSHKIMIRTLEGDMKADRDDWIIRGIEGEFYPCKPDIFEKSYDALEDLTPTTEG